MRSVRAERDFSRLGLGERWGVALTSDVEFQRSRSGRNFIEISILKFPEFQDLSRHLARSAL